MEILAVEIFPDARSKAELSGIWATWDEACAWHATLPASILMPQPVQLTRHVVLIDGIRLAALMIRYDVGVRVEEALYLKKIDEDFFPV